MNECEIFMAALDISSSVRRSAFLEQACGRDRLLRARIEALLSSHTDAGSLLEQPALGVLATPHFDTIALRPGDTVGPYKLLEQIGEGGMGVVFRAEQSKPVQRTVALKIVRPGMDSRQVMARFAAERQALALMDHTNIARVLDTGTTESGRYIVMELVDGVPVTKYCDDHRLSLRPRLELFLQICQGVQHAHQKGIIHRDLKPSNVLIAICDGQPVPKIIDFGIAKSNGPNFTNATVLTELGQLVGTLEYMSPEQAEMNQLDIDTRSDIYSLGVLLYELLTGTTPLERGRLKNTALLDGLRLIREEEPPRPSNRLAVTETLPTSAANRGQEAKKLISQVRGDLDWIAMNCLEKNRDRRYATANGLASDVQHYLLDEPVLARPPSAIYRFRKFARRYRSSIAIVAAFATVLLTAVIVSAWLAVRALNASAQARANETRAMIMEQEARVRAQQARHAAQAEREARQKEAAHRQRAEEISRFLVSAFSRPDTARPDSAVTLADTLARLEREVKVADDSPTKADLLHIIAESYYDLGLYRQAILPWEDVRVYLVGTFGADHPTTLAVCGNLAVTYMRAGRIDDARELFEELLERMQKTLGSHHRQTRITMIHLAENYRKGGQLDKALPLSERALSLAKADSDPSHSHTLWAMRNLAEAYLAVSRIDESLRLYQERVNVSLAALGPEHPNTLASIRTLAAQYATHGRLIEAAEEYRRIFRNEPDNHGVALRSAMLSLAAGNQEDYEADCRKLLDRFRRTENGLAANRTSLACLISSPPTGEIEQLVRLADLAVATCQNSPSLVERVINCRTRGLAAYRTSDFREAVKWCAESRTLEKRRGSFPPYLATNLIIEAMAWHQQGNSVAARAEFDQSARLIEQHYPRAPVELGSDWFDWLLYDLLRREAAELLNLQDAADTDQNRVSRDDVTDTPASSPTGPK